jgi:glutaredoxin 3
LPQGGEALFYLIVQPEIDVTGKATLRAELRDKSGGRHTVPQIWIGECHIGGCDDLMCLDRAGKLDPLLCTTK